MCEDRKATIVGTPEAGKLFGTDNRDVFNARSGDDVIFGLGGDDKICGEGDED